MARHPQMWRRISITLAAATATLAAAAAHPKHSCSQNNICPPPLEAKAPARALRSLGTVLGTDLIFSTSLHDILRTSGGEGAGEGLAQLGDRLGDGLHEGRQEARRQPIPQDALHKQPDGAHVDPRAEGLRVCGGAGAGEALLARCSWRGCRQLSGMGGCIDTTQSGPGCWQHSKRVQTCGAADRCTSLAAHPPVQTCLPYIHPSVQSCRFGSQPPGLHGQGL